MDTPVPEAEQATILHSAGASERQGTPVGHDQPHSTSGRQTSEAEAEEEEAVEGSLTWLMDEDRWREPLRQVRAFGGVPGCECEAVEVEQDSRSLLGGRVWRSSYVLLQLLHELYPQGLGGMHILELGSGTGLLGIALAKQHACSRHATPPAKVVLTDQEELLPLLHRNMHRNGVGPPRCEGLPLDWLMTARDEARGGQLQAVLSHTPGGSGFDLLVCSDCVYYSHLYEGLLATLQACCKEGGVVVLVNDDGRTAAKGGEAEEERWDASFYRLMTSKGFRITQDRLLRPSPSALPVKQQQGGGPYRAVVAAPPPKQTESADESERSKTR